MDMERDVKAEEATTVEAVPVQVEGVAVEEKFEDNTIEAENVSLIPMLMQAADPKDASQAIRDDFIYLLCCAFSCSNCDFPQCWGNRTECTICCVQNSSICCKVVNDEKACFICNSGGIEWVWPRVLYSEYSQCFCCEYYAALPPVNGPFKKINNRPDKVTVNFKQANDARFCNGCCCSLTSCNCNFPACLGCYNKSVCCCWEDQCIYQKPMCFEREKFNKDTCCIVWQGHRTCVMPYTCCKSISSCCCYDSRCAFPCDEEVPCICSACCFCTCCIDWGVDIRCCASFNSMMKGKQGDAMVNLVRQGAGQNVTHTVNTVNNPALRAEHQHNREVKAQQAEAVKYNQ